MPVALHSWKIDDDGEIRVRHTFFARTEAEADKLLEQHAGGCKAYGPAVEQGDTIEIVEEIDELPDAEALEDIDGDGDDGEEGEDQEEEEEVEA
jgi:hypothetical protein